MEARAQSDYRKYSNEDLAKMISQLRIKGIIGEDLHAKMTDAIFNRIVYTKRIKNRKIIVIKRPHHYRHYRRKLIRMYKKFLEHKEELDYIRGKLDDYAYLSIDGAISNNEYLRMTRILGNELEEIKKKIKSNF